MNKQHKRIVNAPFVGIAERSAGDVEIWHQVSGAFFGQLERDGEPPVPKPAMMCGDVPQNIKVIKQGAKRFFIKLIIVCNGLSDGWVAKLSDEIRDIAK